MIRTCALCSLTENLPNSQWRGVKLGRRIIHKKCYYKEYAKTHQEDLRRNKRNWILADPERFKATQIKYRESGKAETSREKLIALNPEDYREKAVARANKAKELNPGRYRAYQAAYQRIRRAILLHPINMTHITPVTDFYLAAPEELEVDHIIPLKNKMVCGLHVPWNLQYLSREDNAIKSNKFDNTYDNEGWRDS